MLIFHKTQTFLYYYSTNYLPKHHYTTITVTKQIQFFFFTIHIIHIIKKEITNANSLNGSLDNGNGTQQGGSSERRQQHRLWRCQQQCVLGFLGMGILGILGDFVLKNFNKDQREGQGGMVREGEHVNGGFGSDLIRESKEG